MEEAATPFPSEETTPPVTKIYFGAIHAALGSLGLSSLPGLLALHRSDVQTIMVGSRESVNASGGKLESKIFCMRSAIAVHDRNIFPQAVFVESGGTVCGAPTRV